MKKLFLLIPLILLMVLSSCEGIFNSDDGPKLPPITTTGEDTFGCKIDGKVFVNYTSGILSNPSLIKSFYKSDLKISAYNTNWNNTESSCGGSFVRVFFNIDSNLRVNKNAKIEFEHCRTGKYVEKLNKYKLYSCYIEMDSNPNDSFEIVNYDTTDSDYIFFSCKFNGIVEAEDGDTKKITDGRFDVKILK